MKTYVMIPTYNERENIGNLIREILNLKIPDLHVVVVDDNSPDGTSEIVKSLAKRTSRSRTASQDNGKGTGFCWYRRLQICLRTRRRLCG